MQITIIMQDVPDVSEIPPAIGTDVITVTVDDVNDPPSIHLLGQERQRVLFEDKSEPVQVSFFT